MKLVWLDLETTGLDAQEDRILEIAVFTSELLDPFNLTHVYGSVVHYPAVLMDPRVFEMHHKSGLLDECDKTKKTLSQVAEELLLVSPLLGPLAPYEDRSVLAGSTVHFDRAFLKRWLPEFEARFHHRHFDVSAMKLLAQALGMPPFPKGGEAHRAAADVLESARHARKVAKWLTDPPILRWPPLLSHREDA